MSGTPVCFEVDGLVAFRSMQVYRDNSLGEGPPAADSSGREIPLHRV